MKYRIKHTTFKNGREEYKPQVKRLFFWQTICENYDSIAYFPLIFDTEKEAKNVIREQQLSKVKFHEFKYLK